ncbi:MAG: DNA polymerase III subunit gamma/tau [Anaeromyxobacter sp.]|nr:DNA polymerase III subunit gamma/tau [Anaeromyxobacter sp.]
MAYLVLARKYRPQRFGEMSGQAHVVQTLSNALQRGQLAHAFLFTGPRGVGKTTAARLVAKAVNCERGPTAEPCGACTPCVEIAEGRAVDVVEIDAASNNGVDNVRDIVEAVKYRPARDRFKVFIIDEVHMLSQGAFNALLKTLEEPPDHVKFVLATTDVHKVPETIVSRCQRFDFRRLTLQQIADQLGHVAHQEGMTLSPAALALVARAAEGGMRDALSLLDRVRAACGDAPADADVAEALGTVDGAAIARMAGALLARDGAGLLAEIATLHERGLEMKRVAEALARHLRDVVVARLAPAAPLDLSDVELAEVRAQAGRADPAQLTRLFDLAQRAVVEAKLADQPRHALEVALLKAIFLAPGAEVSELLARVEALAGGTLPPPSGGSGSGGPGARPGPPPAPGPAPAPAAPPRTRTAPEPLGMGRDLPPVGTPGCAAGPGTGGWSDLPAAAIPVEMATAPARVEPPSPLRGEGRGEGFPTSTGSAPSPHPSPPASWGRGSSSGRAPRAFPGRASLSPPGRGPG